MIREMRLSDLDSFEPNEVSDPTAHKHIFSDDRWWVYVLENKQIKAIICFIEEKQGEWAVFTFISKYFTARDSVEMRQFMQRAEGVLKPKRVWTASPDNEKVNKWHRFYNLMIDSPMEYEGKTYNRWVRA